MRNILAFIKLLKLIFKFLSGLFSVISYQIPVLFDKRQLSLYSLHLTQEEIESCSVYINPEEILYRGAKASDILRRIPYSDILYKRRIIRRVSWRLQYSLPPIVIGASNYPFTPMLNQMHITGIVPNYYLNDYQSHIDIKHFVPPYIDALEIILGSLIEKQVK